MPTTSLQRIIEAIPARLTRKAYSLMTLQVKIFTLSILLFLLCSCGSGSNSAYDESYLQTPPAKDQTTVSAAVYFPPGYTTNGSVSYQAELQKAVKYAAKWQLALVFPSMTYLLDNENGLELFSNMDIDLRGVVLKTSSNMNNDGQVLFGENIQNVKISGGGNSRYQRQLG